MNVDDIYRPPQADMAAPAPQALGKPADTAPFFQTSPLKIAVLSVTTLGLYQLTWFYRQWDRRQDQGDDVSPLGRTLFHVFFVYGLFKRVNEEIDLRADLEAAQREPGSQAMPGDRIAHLQGGLLAVLFIGLGLGCSVASQAANASLLGAVSALLSWVPLVIVQKKINELHASLGYDPSDGTAFTAGSIVVVILGALWWLLVVIGLSMRL